MFSNSFGGLFGLVGGISEMKIKYERKREELPGELMPVVGRDLIRKGGGGVSSSTDSPLKQYNKN